MEEKDSDSICGMLVSTTSPESLRYSLPTSQCNAILHLYSLSENLKQICSLAHTPVFAGPMNDLIWDGCPAPYAFAISYRIPIVC